MTDWDIIHKQALKCKDNGIEWKSLGEKTSYFIKTINPNEIVLAKTNGGKDEAIHHLAINRNIQNLKRQKQLTPKEVASHVIRQSAIVFLHPFIQYNKVKKYMIWDESFKNDFIETIIDEANTYELEKILTLINKRNGQKKFKENLLKIFNNKCAISDVCELSVLEAAHIIQYSKTGDSSNSNGIILRSDLHKLFDRNLLKVNPSTFEIILDESLLETEYKKYNGHKISFIENEKLRNNLLTRWNDNYK